MRAARLGSAGLAPRPEPPERPAEFRFDRAELGIDHVRPRDDDDIQARWQSGVPEQLPNEALGPVPDDRAAHLPRGGDSQPAVTERVRSRHHRHQPPANPLAVLVDAQKLGAAPNPAGGRKRAQLRFGRIFPGHLGNRPESAGYDPVDTLNRFRPLARRRFNTRRPPLVAMRTRNPWVFLRRRLFG